MNGIASLAAAVLLAATTSSPILVALPRGIVITDGSSQRYATAGASTSNYRILETLSDGSVAISFSDAGAVGVETISPSLASRAIKTLPPGTIVAPSVDGFLASDSGGLTRRYDAGGSMVGAPMPVSVSDPAAALGLAGAVIISGGGTLSSYDNNGSLRHQTQADAISLVPLGTDRFAAIERRSNQVRIYGTDLSQVAALSPSRTARLLAGSPDGTLAVLVGDASCVSGNGEIDVYSDVTKDPSARIPIAFVQPRALALAPDATLLAEGGCRVNEGVVGVWGRDGSSRGTIQLPDAAVGIGSFAPAKP